ncbi:MAG TPA: DinB family protein [Gemmatimonadaceae bacterium]|nr:DinB family protein [Gemmatimonadaceae bacterium]
MTSVATSKTTIPASVDSSILSRLLDEGYGPGAWHGADLRAAVADVSDSTAFWRPDTGRHNIAEIALHHAFCAHSVIGQLTGKDPGPFALEGSDWFELSGGSFGWEAVRSTLDATQQRLAGVVAEIGAGTLASPLAGREQFDLVLGVACHAVYHAGQIQLIKVLENGR